MITTRVHLSHFEKILITETGARRSSDWANFLVSCKKYNLDNYIYINLLHTTCTIENLWRTYYNRGSIFAFLLFDAARSGFYFYMVAYFYFIVLPGFYSLFQLGSYSVLLGYVRFLFGSYYIMYKTLVVLCSHFH